MSEDIAVPLSNDQIDSEAPTEDLSRSQAKENPVNLTTETNNGPENDTTVDMGPSDNVSTLSDSRPANEEVIFLQDYPESAQIIMVRSAINYIITLFALFGIGYAIVGYFILLMYYSNVPDLTYIIFVAASINLFRVLIEFIFIHVSPVNAPKHIAYFFEAITNFIVLQAFLFYLRGNYTSNVLIGFICANVAIPFFKILVLRVDFNLIFGVLINIAEAVTILLVGLKLTDPDFSLSWDFILTFYNGLYYVAIALCGFLGILLLIMIVLKANKNPATAALNWLVVFGFVAFYILIIAVIAFYCFMYFSIRELLETGAFSTLPVVSREIPVGFLYSGYIIYGIAGAMLITAFALLCGLKTRILKTISQGPGKTIILKRYLKRFELKLKAISGRVFRRETLVKPDNRGGSLKVTQDPIPIESCVICQTHPSDFIFTPCNHCFICVECVNVFMTTSAKCSICTQPFTGCYHIEFDKGKMNYLVDYSYKLRQL